MDRRDDIAKRIARALEPLGSPVRAAGEKKYLKSDLLHLGVAIPAIRRLVAAELKQSGDLTHAELVAAVHALWSDVHEERVAAIELLVKTVAQLRATDDKLVEQLLRTSKTWAYVDAIAAHVMGPLVTANPSLGRTLDRWAKDDNFWIRRSALLALLVPLREGGGDFARFARYADLMLDEKEFFIRKAIGWVLRDTSRRRADLVFEWLAPRASRASGVTMREAVKYLSAAQRARLGR